MSLIYEYPLNERIRVLLRLETLFQQLQHELEGSSRWDSRAALLTFIELLGFIGRGELRAELLKELERHHLSLQRSADTRHSPAVHQQVHPVREQLHQLDLLSLEALRQNEFLSAIRQRSSISGGTCGFDLPVLQHWLSQPEAWRQYNLQSWLQPLLVFAHAIDVILLLVRSSRTTQFITAEQGFLQRALEANTSYQLLQVELDEQLSLFPEISGGRQRVSIRFLQTPKLEQRPQAANQPVSFILHCCGV